MYCIATNQCLQFYTASGKRMLFRHPLNNRDQQDTRERYRLEIERKGIIEGARSETIAILQLVDGEPQAQLIAGATLMEAAYLSFEKAPADNTYVAFTRKHGLPNVSIFDPRTPRDVLSYYIDQNNEFNLLGGCKSFMESYNDALEVSALWDESRKAIRKRKREEPREEPIVPESSPPPANSGKKYENEYREWVTTKFSLKFPTLEMYSDAKEGRRKLTAMNLFDWFSEYCASRCRFSDATLNNKMVLHIINEIAKTLGEQARYHIVVKHLLKFCVPTNDGTPWLLREKADIKKISALLTPMKDSKVFKLSAKPSLTNPGVSLLVPNAKAAKTTTQPLPKRGSREPKAKAP